MSSKEYAVRVFDSETGKRSDVHDGAYVGSWKACVKRAHEIIKSRYPYESGFTSGLPEDLHVQGDESEPGYVGYGALGSLVGSQLWITISDANPPPPIEREPFDYDGAIRESAQIMLSEIVKPENVDLLEAVKGVGNDSGPNGNFMFGFRLEGEQKQRWDTIVDKGDKHGHSGASYAFACRHLQTLLAEI